MTFLAILIRWTMEAEIKYLLYSIKNSFDKLKYKKGIQEIRTHEQNF